MVNIPFGILKKTSVINLSYIDVGLFNFQKVHQISAFKRRSDYLPYLSDYFLFLPTLTVWAVVETEAASLFLLWEKISILLSFPMSMLRLFLDNLESLPP